MAKFNTATARRAVKAPNTVNLAGGSAFSQSDEMQFASILLTSFVQDQYYRSEKGTLNELKSLIPKVDPVFAAQAAIYARNEYGMRSITHVVAGEVAARVKGEEWTKRFIEKVVRRPDDATEILAYYLSTYGKPVPNSLKKGLALALQKFDGYQLAKYRGDKNAVSLVDVINLVHIKPTAENADVLAKLVDGELKSEATWEARLSKAGKSENKEAAKQEAWTDLIESGRIGQFALLRNLRNIESQAPEVLPQALKLLVNEKRVRSSLILPFRYATAIDEVSDRKTISALSKAVDIACANVPRLEGKSVLAIDHSGSMGGMWGRVNSKSPQGIADLFAAVMFKALDADVVVFGDRAGYVTGLNPDDSTLTIMKQISKVNYGHGTSFGSVFQTLNKKYARVITLSDMQSWGGGWNSPAKAAAAYESRKKAKPYMYNFDLAGHGTLQFPRERVFEMVGFSDKVFDVMQMLETDKHALVNAIKQIVI